MKKTEISLHMYVFYIIGFKITNYYFDYFNLQLAKYYESTW